MVILYGSHNSHRKINHWGGSTITLHEVLVIPQGSKWCLHKWGYPQIINFDGFFSQKNHPFLGYLHDYGTPQSDPRWSKAPRASFVPRWPAARPPWCSSSDNPSSSADTDLSQWSVTDLCASPLWRTCVLEPNYNIYIYNVGYILKNII